MKYLTQLLTLIALTINTSFSAEFDTGSSTLNPETKERLTKIYEEQIKDKNVSKITVNGYADSRGSRGLNQVLSEKRAIEAITFLSDLAKEPNFRLAINGHGEDELLTLETTLEAHAKNRRVTVEVVGSVMEVSECKEEINKHIIRHAQAQATSQEAKKIKNIISLGIVSSKTKLTKEDMGATIDSYNERDLGVSIKYQRFVSDKIILGLETDTNKTLGAFVGYGF